MAHTLRELVDRPGRPLVLGGVFDALSARIAEAAGVDGVYISGYSLSATRFAQPDIGWTTLGEMAEALSQVVRAVDVPVVVDGETGFGNAVNVVRMIREFESAGASGVQLGDEAEETCPYLGFPTRILGEDEACLKYRAAAEARRSPDFLIFASPQENPERGVAYVEAGASGVLFPWEPMVLGGEESAEASRMKGWMQELCSRGAIMIAVTGAFLPPVKSDVLASLGYRIIVPPTEAMYASAKAQADMWSKYMASVSTEKCADRFMSQEAFRDLVDEAGMRELAERFLPHDQYTETSGRVQYVRNS